MAGYLSHNLTGLTACKLTKNETPSHIFFFEFGKMFQSSCPQQLLIEHLRKAANKYKKICWQNCHH